MALLRWGGTKARACPARSDCENSFLEPKALKRELFALEADMQLGISFAPLLSQFGATGNVFSADNLIIAVIQGKFTRNLLERTLNPA